MPLSGCLLLPLVESTDKPILLIMCGGWNVLVVLYLHNVGKPAALEVRSQV